MMPTSIAFEFGRADDVPPHPEHDGRVIARIGTELNRGFWRSILAVYG